MYDVKKIEKVMCIYHEDDTMTTDAAKGFEKNGLKVCHEKLTKIANNKVEFQPVDIIKKVLIFQPDIVFFLNTFGIDEKCNLLKTFSILGVKSVAWFIDNPFYFYNHLINMKNINNLFVLSWDKFYINELLDMGVKDVFYLPQATSLERFFPFSLDKSEEKIFKQKLTFAGNLDLFTINSHMQQLFVRGLNERLCYKLIDDCSEMILLKKNKVSHKVVSNYIDQHEFPSAFKENIYLLAKIIEYKLSIGYRVELIKQLGSFGVSVWGAKEDWQHVTDETQLLGRVSYFNNMPKVYKGSDINLNISRIQQRTGTNQRVFDVPACKSFLITDYKEELEDMFDLEKELVTYKNFQELFDKILFFQDKNKRLKVIEKGYEKVERQHTYVNRMKTLVDYVQPFALQKEKLSDSGNSQAVFWIAKALIQLKRIKEAGNYLKVLAKEKKYFKEVAELLSSL